MSTLSIEEVLPDLDAALEHNANAALQAPPGAGKTTRVTWQPWMMPLSVRPECVR